MADEIVPIPEVASAAPAPVAVPEAPPAAPKQSFRDVKVRRISERDAKEPVKVEAPLGAIPGAGGLPPTAAAGTENAAGAATEPGVTAGETALEEKPEEMRRAFVALHNQKKKIKAREEAIKALEGKVRERDELADLLGKSQLAFARRVGLDLRKLNEEYIEEQQHADPRTSQVQREVQELKAQLAKRDQDALEAQKATLRSELRRDIHDSINEKREELKYITAYDKADEVYETVLTFEEVHGRLPTEADVEQLAKKVDSALKTKHEAALKRLGGTAPAQSPAVTAPRSISTLRSAQAPEATRETSRSDRIRRTAEIFRTLSKA